MDDYKKILNTCGVGGIKCKCCRPTTKKTKKDRSWSRAVRRKMKMKQKEKNDE